jgi:catechol 2,3-dioxygenase-like lactoylglutathione lyase family enzyme
MNISPFTANFHHISLSVANLDAQRLWYERALSLHEVVEQVTLPDPPVRTVVLRASNGLRVELIERAGSTRPEAFTDPLDASRLQGYGHWALEVTNLDQAYTQLIESGAQPVWPPAPAIEPGAHFAYVKDPEGNLLELIEPPQAN